MTLSPNHPAGHVRCPASRRDFLLHAGAGFGGLALSCLLAEGSAPPPAAGDGRGGTTLPASPPRPLAARKPHFPARARSVIWCFLDGGPSHLDLFDPKPALTKLHGKPLPDSFERPMTAMGVTAHSPLLASRRKFARHGKSGLWVSDWYPEIASCVDDLAMLHSCQTEGQTHVGGVSLMNTGALLAGRPSVGAWALYGLGAETQTLPGFVVLADNKDEPPGGSRNWGAGFMPATYQGTRFRHGTERVLYTTPPAGTTAARQRRKLDYINERNRHYQSGRVETDHIDAQIAAYELAFRMQTAAPEAADVSKETTETLHLYGVDRKETEANGLNCLLARRLVERGVRFVQLYMGAGSAWDAHSDLESNHGELCRATDRPIAGLLKDLKRRGLLDSTLVIWGGEFGRTPMSESGNGRDHNTFGFTVWLAGGGVKGGTTYGATDEVGLWAVDRPTHVRDVHATILHLLGLDHKGLIFAHNGRDERATINGGKVIREIVG